MARHGVGARPDYGHRWRKLREEVRRRQAACHICGGGIDPELRYPHPGSFTVDHLEPVALRPELALVLSNLAAAHAACNRQRGVGRRRSGGRLSREW